MPEESRSLHEIAQYALPPPGVAATLESSRRSFGLLRGGLERRHAQSRRAARLLLLPLNTECPRIVGTNNEREVNRVGPRFPRYQAHFELAPPTPSRETHLRCQDILKLDVGKICSPCRLGGVLPHRLPPL